MCYTVDQDEKDYVDFAEYFNILLLTIDIRCESGLGTGNDFSDFITVIKKSISNDRDWQMVW